MTMTGVMRWMSSAVMVTATICAATARAETVVEFIVRDLDGGPAANTVVSLTPAGRISHGHETPETKVTTDADGRAQYAPNVLTSRLRVTVPGVGFAVTDAFDPEILGKTV